MNDPASAILGLVILGAVFAGAVAAYFLPSIVGSNRRIASRNALIAVNCLFGWTVIVWVAALIWAALGQTEDQARLIRAQLAALDARA